MQPTPIPNNLGPTLLLVAGLLLLPLGVGLPLLLLSLVTRCIIPAVVTGALPGPAPGNRNVPLKREVKLGASSRNWRRS